MIPGRIGRQKIRNGVPGASRTREKSDGPLRDSPLLYMNVLAGRRLSDVFLLQDQSEGRFRAGGFLRKTKSVRIGGECIVIVVSVLRVRRTALRVAPYTVLQNGVPDEASARERRCGVLADPRRIDCPGKSRALFHNQCTPVTGF